MASSSCSPPSAAVSHLSKGYERLTQLRALLLSSSPEKPSAVAPTISLLDEALRCLAAAMSKLQACPPFPIPSTGVKDGKKETISPKRRKIQSWTLVTSVPHFDGHQWRKYGQKHIDGAEFPRSYFKCTYRKDQGCPATKTVQRTEGGDTDSPNYEVRYRMQHNCKAMEADGFPFVMDSSTVINRNKTPDCSHELSTSGAPAASPEHSFPALLPLQDDGGIYDCSLWDQVPLPEPPLNPASAELGEEENGGGGSSGNPSPSLGELDFDWAWLMSWSSSAELDES